MRGPRGRVCAGSASSSPLYLGFGRAFESDDAIVDIVVGGVRIVLSFDDDSCSWSCKIKNP